MGHEWLEELAAVLTAAGIPTAEGYPAAGVPELTWPVAALEVEKADPGHGTVRLGARIISPRKLGGWACQSAAVTAAAALAGAGYSCETGRMEYLSDIGCFCVAVTVEAEICLTEGVWTPGKSWQVACNDAELPGVSSFEAVQDRGRRLVGAFCQGEPVGVTGGTTGWSITLVQQLGHSQPQPEEPEEPFMLTVRRAGETATYGECCWNRIRHSCTQSGLVLERSGFALTREVVVDG